MLTTTQDHIGIATAPEDSHRVIRVDALRQTDESVYNRKFEASFLKTMQNPANEGLLTTYLFYDLPQDNRASSLFSNLSYDARNILSGGKAWDRHIQDSIDDRSAYGFWDGDQSIISTSLQQGLLTHLPRTIKFISYGCGDTHAFESKESQIISAVYNDVDRDIADFCAVDILRRYAVNGAIIAHDKYGIKAYGVVGDFLYNGKLAIEDNKGTPVVMIFGGAFENTPIVEGALSPIDTTAVAWAKMNLQHGLDSVIIKTFDSDQNPQTQLTKYAPSRNFEAFILSAFARAAQQGLIKDQQYDVFSNWRMKTEFDVASSAVKLIAECKKSHTFEIAGKSYSFTDNPEAPDKRTITLSHKWDEATHVKIAERAGFEVKEIYRENQNPNRLMIAQAVRRPDPELRALINGGY
jgi:hypothetical protein